MARYTVHVRSTMSPPDAFDAVADLHNFAVWDPGVRRVEQVEGDGAGQDAAFDVTVAAGIRPLTLTYRLTSFERPRRFVAEARSTFLDSIDTITVRPDGDGSVVTYDAELELNGPLRLADPVLGLVFGRIGDRAAAGLVEFLGGERLDSADELDEAAT